MFISRYFRSIFIQDMNGMGQKGCCSEILMDCSMMVIPPGVICNLFGFKLTIQERIGSSILITFLPVCKNTKGGYICLSLPASLFIMDLAIYVDISRNPGPSGPSEDFVCRQNQPSFSNLTGTRFDAFNANKKLNY